MVFDRRNFLQTLSAGTLGAIIVGCASNSRIIRPVEGADMVYEGLSLQEVVEQVRRYTKFFSGTDFFKEELWVYSSEQRKLYDIGTSENIRFEDLDSEINTDWQRLMELILEIHGELIFIHSHYSKRGQSSAPSIGDNYKSAKYISILPERKLKFCVVESNGYWSYRPYGKYVEYWIRYFEFDENGKRRSDKEIKEFLIRKDTEFYGQLEKEGLYFKSMMDQAKMICEAFHRQWGADVKFYMPK